MISTILTKFSGTKYIPSLTVQTERQMSGVIRLTTVPRDDSAESPYSLWIYQDRQSTEEREPPSRDSSIQVCGEIRRGVTQSPFERTLTIQPTGLALYSHTLPRHSRPAASSPGGSTAQPCHTRPGRNQSGKNPTAM